MFILIYAVNWFYVFPVICYIKTRPNVKFPLYLKKAGLEIQSKYHVQRQKTFYVLSVSAFIFSTNQRYPEVARGRNQRLSYNPQCILFSPQNFA